VSEPAFTLHLGDCLDPVTGMASLGDKSVDHVITDPPYEAEAHTLQRRVKRGLSADGVDMRVAEVEALDFAPMTEDQRDLSAYEIGRVARRWALVFCQAEAVGLWKQAMLMAGLNWKRSCIWVKPDGMPQLTGDRPGMGYESIACAHGDGASRWNGGGSHGVFKVSKSDDRTGHPTQKPIALMEKLIRLFTDPGDLILDPFAGSGTTGVAAIRLGRRFIGWEKDPKYHAIALKRLKAAREQLELCA